MTGKHIKGTKVTNGKDMIKKKAPYFQSYIPPNSLTAELINYGKQTSLIPN